MRYEYGDFGEEIPVFKIGDVVIYNGNRVLVLEVDDDIQDIKIMTQYGRTKWIKQSEVE